MPNIERQEPPYLQVVRHIRDQIVSGQLAAGESVPSARQITQQWGVAMATAQKALTTLRSEGLVRTVPGRGTLVDSNHHHGAHDRSTAVLRTGRIYPPGHYAKIVDARLVAAPDQVADALGIAPGDPAIRRQRTTYNAQGEPLSTSISWFVGALAGSAPLLLQPERIKQGTARYIEEQTGRIRGPLDQDTTYLAAGEANSAEAEQLRIDEGSAVLHGQNFYRDTAGDVIEYGESTSLQGLKVRIGRSNEEEK